MNFPCINFTGYVRQANTGSAKEQPWHTTFFFFIIPPGNARAKGLAWGKVFVAPHTASMEGIAHPWLTETGRRWTHLASKLGEECLGLQGSLGRRKGSLFGTSQRWPAALGEAVLPPCHPKMHMKPSCLINHILQKLRDS